MYGSALIRHNDVDIFASTNEYTVPIMSSCVVTSACMLELTNLTLNTCLNLF